MNARILLTLVPYLLLSGCDGGERSSKAIDPRIETTDSSQAENVDVQIKVAEDKTEFTVSEWESLLQERSRNLSHLAGKPVRITGKVYAMTVLYNGARLTLENEDHSFRVECMLADDQVENGKGPWEVVKPGQTVTLEFVPLASDTRIKQRCRIVNVKGDPVKDSMDAQQFADAFKEDAEALTAKFISKRPRIRQINALTLHGTVDRVERKIGYGYMVVVFKTDSDIPVVAHFSVFVSKLVPPPEIGQEFSVRGDFLGSPKMDGLFGELSRANTIGVVEAFPYNPPE